VEVLVNEVWVTRSTISSLGYPLSAHIVDMHMDKYMLEVIVPVT
jgi:hypothetical protein